MKLYINKFFGELVNEQFRFGILPLIKISKNKAINPFTGDLIEFDEMQIVKSIIYTNSIL